MPATVSETNLKSTIGQDRSGHLALLCVERAYVNRVDIEKAIDKFLSKNVVPSSFSNRFLDQKSLLIYFKSMLAHGNLSY